MTAKSFLKENVSGFSKRQVLGIGIGALVLISTSIYVGFGLSTQNKMAVASRVDGVDVGLMTKSQAVDRFSDHVIDIQNAKGETVKHVKLSSLISKSEFEADYDTLHAKQHPWLLNLTGKLRYNRVPKSIDKRVGVVAAAIPSTDQAATNASAKYVDGAVSVTQAKAGTRIVVDKLQTQLVRALKSGNTVISRESLVEQPKITATSAEFQKAKTALETTVGQTDTIKYADKSTTIDQTKLQSMVYVDGDAVKVDRDAVKSYVIDLNKSVSTKNKPFKFQTHAGELINTTSTGSFGWTIDIDKTTEAIASQLTTSSGFTVTADLVGTGKNVAMGVGGTYVEVSIAEQHEWVYQGGKLILDSDVVTGLPSNGHDTPKGVYYIWSKQRNATLRGTNDDGSSYASPVGYWMPIDDTGVGLHDSPWQPQYGGKWYLSHGSHGCVNNPPAFAATLFAAVSLDEPVVIY